MTAIDELLARNLAAAEYHPVGMGPMPTLKIALLMCMDARIDGHGAFRLNLGEVHLLRNAGGVVSDDALRSLIISHWLLGTEEALVIAHTGCGMLTFTNDDINAKLADEAGADATGIDFLPFPDLDDSVREIVARVRSSDLLPDSFTATGYIYDCSSGALREVA